MHFKRLFNKIKDVIYAVFRGVHKKVGGTLRSGGALG